MLKPGVTKDEPNTLAELVVRMYAVPMSEREVTVTLRGLNWDVDTDIVKKILTDSGVAIRKSRPRPRKYTKGSRR